MLLATSYKALDGLAPPVATIPHRKTRFGGEKLLIADRTFRDHSRIGCKLLTPNIDLLAFEELSWHLQHLQVLLL